MAVDVWDVMIYTFSYMASWRLADYIQSRLTIG